MIKGRLPALLYFHILLLGTISFSAYQGWIPACVTRIPYSDKPLHFLLAGSLGFWAALPFSNGQENKRWAIAALAGLSALIGFEEAIQVYSPQRSPDLVDLAADLLGLWVFWRIGRRWFLQFRDGIYSRSACRSPISKYRK